MKIFILLSLFILGSCTSEMSNSEKNETAAKLHIQKNDNFNQILLDNISFKIENSKNIDHFYQVKIYDSLSREYFDYLNSIENKIKKNGNEIFFKNNTSSVTGNEFIKKTERYKSEIENLPLSSNFRKQLSLLFSVENVEIENGVYLDYLDYYFKGYPYVWSEFHINEMKSGILELENEFINEFINSFIIKNTE